MENVPLTIQAIFTVKGTKENIGFIECPKCKGKLNYSKASINGHTIGKCETEKCISWME